MNREGITYGEIDGYTYEQYSGTYGSTGGCGYTSQVVDLGKVTWSNVNFCFSFEAFSEPENTTYADIVDRTYGDHVNDTYGNITVPYNTVITVRFSNDNSTWTDWQTYVSGEYYFRYIQYKITVTYSPNSRFYIKSLQQYYDVHDVNINKTISVAAGGTVVTYDEEFFTVPTDIIMNIMDSTTVYPRYTDSTKSSIRITCYNSSGTSVPGTVQLIVHGY